MLGIRLSFSKLAVSQAFFKIELQVQCSTNCGFS